jgi:PAS domain S-box-containing protein
MPSLSAFRAWSQSIFTAKSENTTDQAPVAPTEGVFDHPIPSSAPPTDREKRAALALVAVSIVVFVVTAPVATKQLPELWAFIPIYQSALAINDFITAALLFIQYFIVRSRALLVLACGYLFTCIMVIVHGLSFPGLFAATGLLGAGPQTTAWLYMFWHGGFPLAVIAYAWLRDDRSGSAERFSDRTGAEQSSVLNHILIGVGAVAGAAAVLTLLATAGHGLLPPIMAGHNYTNLMLGVVSTVWLLSVVALVAVWRLPRHASLDLWLMVVLCAWIFDIGLSAVLNHGRFDVGFYGGRLFGLLAATYVLVALLAKTGALYASMARLLDKEQVERRRESAIRRRIFDTSLDLIFISDRRGNLMQVSPSCEAILGYQPSEMVGRSAMDFLYPPDLENTRNEMRSASRGAPIRTFDCRYVHKNGRVVSLSWKGVWSEPDQQHFFVGRDMTQRLALEQQLRHAQKMEAIGQLTGGIAHDFNNILAVIIGMAELTAAAVAKDPKVLGMVKQIDAAAERGAMLVQRMLAFARKQQLETGVIDLNAVVQRSVALLERTLGEHIALQTVLAADLWPALADQAQLEDAIVNLALNARDAMPNGGRLVIETTNAHLDQAYAAENAEVTAGDYVALDVTDSGSGMSPEIVERAFEPFFTTKEVGRGTGLGLSMVYGFVKQSRGHVKIYSEIGHGTRVRLYLPRALEQASPSSKGSAQPAMKMPVGQEAILVVEDDPSVRGMAVSSLEGLGYRVHEAPDGKSAIEVLSKVDQIDLLFTDMIMPNGMNGHELIRAAREMRPSLKVLLTSGYSDQFIKTADGAPDVRLLSKPYRRDGLATAVRAALDGGA